MRFVQKFDEADVKEAEEDGDEGDEEERELGGGEEPHSLRIQDTSRR